MLRLDFGLKTVLGFRRFLPKFIPPSSLCSSGEKIDFGRKNVLLRKGGGKAPLRGGHSAQISKNSCKVLLVGPSLAISVDFRLFHAYIYVLERIGRNRTYLGTVLKRVLGQKCYIRAIFTVNSSKFD